VNRGYAYPFSRPSSPFSHPFSHLSHLASPFSLRYWKILENTGNTSIADTGRFWKILVIPVLQILKD
jgi:hypothetical protein